ncbi:MAG TPA: hypothetical protein VGC62_24490 [Pseudomonas sp.]|uniref:hypothetical protein n=1 Tax=Pseudomonas sp. TaxID=306 RepID=UPI002ED7A7B5
MFAKRCPWRTALLASPTSWLLQVELRPIHRGALLRDVFNAAVDQLRKKQLRPQKSSSMISGLSKMNANWKSPEKSLTDWHYGKPAALMDRAGEIACLPSSSWLNDEAPCAYIHPSQDQ